jgi:hypothetical protein
MSIISFIKGLFKRSEKAIAKEIEPVVEAIKEEIVEISDAVAEAIAEEAVAPKPKKRYYKRKKK